MPSDARAAQAKAHHAAAAKLEGNAATHRRQRDILVRKLRAEDPEKWTYRAISLAIGCSPELVWHIIHSKPRTNQQETDE